MVGDDWDDAGTEACVCQVVLVLQAAVIDTAEVVLNKAGVVFAWFVSYECFCLVCCCSCPWLLL